MSVYIKGMEMPKRCYTCPCADLEFYDCNLMPGTRIEQHKRLDDCPLVPVPDHGRLVDKDVVCAECRRVAEEYDGIYPDCTYCPIHLAPTIIPGEEVDNG